MPRHFVGRVPVVTKAGSLYAPLEWDEMSLAHVETWHAYVQPHIRHDTRRADGNWDWRKFFLGLFPVFTFKLRSPKGLVAMAYSDRGEAVPVGMLFLLTRYPRIDCSREKSAFAVFLATAPKAALLDLGVSKIPELGRYLVDCGLVISTKAKLSGHFWLHCAPEGGKFLFDFYADDCQLKQHPESRRLPRVDLRANDGRYFFSDEGHTEELLSQLDALRVTT